MKVRVLFTHPQLGGHHFITEIDTTIEEYRVKLKEHGYKVVFIKEVGDDE